MFLILKSRFCLIGGALSNCVCVVQVDDLSNRVGNLMKAQGIRKGDKVALLMESRPDFVCMWMGLAKIGATTALINFNLRSDPLVHSITVASAKAIIVGSELASGGCGATGIRGTPSVSVYESLRPRTGVYLLFLYIACSGSSI